ncbi:cyclin-D6-1-like [Mercurialis annua]|uniref:cyclin-D6-1-like n=1 Tax=Mercurialis annua TaxID=3986 RepID=UPI00215E76C3|nr:cyclin-D6-1-like [Mercurialis annua]
MQSGQRLTLFERKQVEKWLATEPESLNVRASNDPEFGKLRAKIELLIAENDKDAQFDATIRYLALNFFDRFSSMDTMPTLGKKDFAYHVTVLVMSCLLIALKMKGDSFSKIMNLKNWPKMKIDEKDIDKMESLILKRTGPPEDCVNALFYVPSFLSIVEEGATQFKSNVIRLITQSHGAVKFVQFRPSVIAASAILTNIENISLEKHHDCMKRFTVTDLQLNKEELESCQNTMFISHFLRETS